MRISRHIGFTSPLLLVLTCLFIYLPVRGEDTFRLPVRFNDSYETTYISALKKNGIVYASLDDLCSVLQVRFTYNSQKQKYVIRAGVHGIVITTLNPFILVDDTPYQMARPTILYKDNLYLPLPLFLPLIQEYLPARASWNQEAVQLDIIHSRYNVTGVEVEKKVNGTLIRIGTTAAFSKDDVEIIINRDWLLVTINGASLDTLNLSSIYEKGPVRKIKSFQFQHAAQITFQVIPKIYDYDLLVNQNEIVVSLRNSTSLDINDLSSAVPTPVEDKKKWTFDCIIIDPGHGGPDPGTSGKSWKTEEKDITLSIAKKLGDMLKKNLDVQVYLTRDLDTRLGKNQSQDLRARTSFANDKGGKLFVSIHCNANNSRRPHGFSAYILGEAKTQEAQQVVELENPVPEEMQGIEEFQDATHILNINNQNMYKKESLDLARMMSENIVKRTKLSLWGKGVREGRFLVLWGAAMPCVLVETGFLSNRNDERLLRTRAEQTRIALALYESIAQFKKKYEKNIGS